jgi:parallel beta-helix repeat protein
MNEYLEPGITTNWDDQMKHDLLAELKAGGIVIDNLTDKQVVERVSSWLLDNYTAYDNIFTTHYIYYPNGQPKIYPGLEYAFQRDKGPYGWTIQEQFEHELLGKGMYYNKTRGTCTSTAVALTTALRAVGIPTRMILVIPVVDASNPSQSQLVEQGVSNLWVRQVVLNGLNEAGRGYTLHTFNEVYVGNQWHRLNYKKLGQPILDEHCFGLHTHLYTFNDLSDANLAPTWGWRYGKGIKNDVFEGDNPYTTMMLSDSKIDTIGQKIYVDDNALDDPAPGNPVISDPCEDGSILHPYDSIQEAIDIADYGNIIVVQEGTYTGFGNRDIDFKGLTITIRSPNPNNPSVVASTIIDCQGSELEPHRGFYFHNNEGTNSILDGLTITGGYVTGNWPQDSGGGIACYDASPTIKNCVITGNTAVHNGGGVYNYHGSQKITNCKFIRNSAGWSGGGVHNGPSSPKVANCLFIENSASSNGGGISSTSGSNPTLTNCTFGGNFASQRGSAIFGYNCNSILTNCILWGNTPSEIYVYGGGTAVVTYSDIQGGWPGAGNIDSNPLFANTNSDDYHLKSQAGRWDPISQAWIQDEVTSLCIDAGDPRSDWSSELWPHGERINMGAYGGTPEASMSLLDAGNIADLDNNYSVNYTDLKMLADEWFLKQFLLSEDINRDGKVNFADLPYLPLTGS